MAPPLMPPLKSLGTFVIRGRIIKLVLAAEVPRIKLGDELEIDGVCYRLLGVDFKSLSDKMGLVVEETARASRAPSSSDHENLPEPPA